MKGPGRLIIFLCCLFLVAGCASMVGKPAPDFSLKDAANRPVQLSDYKGKSSVVLVFYWADS